MTDRTKPVQDGDTVVVWFSCGAASAFTANKSTQRETVVVSVWRPIELLKWRM